MILLALGACVLLFGLGFAFLAGYVYVMYWALHGRWPPS